MVNRKKSHYMLGGLGILKCQKCGSNMHSQKVTSHGSSYPVYYCPNHKDKKCTTKDIKAEPLNKFVASVLTDELKSRKDFSKIISLVNQNDELDLLYRRLNGNKVALQNNLHIYEHNPLPAIKNNIEKLIRKSKELHQRVLDAQSRILILDENNKDKICSSFKETLISSNELEVRNYIKKAVKSITVDNNEVSLELN